MTTGRINQIAIVRLSWLKQQGRGKKKIKKQKKNPKQPTELPQQPRRAEGRPREIHVECCNFFFQNSFSERRTGGGQRLEQADPRRPTNRPNQRQKSTERFLFHPENRAERPDGIREVQWIPRRIEWIRFRTCNGQRRGAMLPAPNHAIHTVRNRVTNQICHLRTHGSSRERGHYETTGRAAILGRMLAIRKAHDWGRSLRTRTQLHTKSWLTFAGRLVTAYVHLARPAKPSDTVCDWNTKAKPGEKKKNQIRNTSRGRAPATFVPRIASRGRAPAAFVPGRMVGRSPESRNP